MNTPADRFPLTRVSVIDAAASEDAGERTAGFAQLAAAYWRPLYVYLRLRHRLTAVDAQDATQSFLASLWDSKTLSTFDPQHGKFRTFMRVCLDRWIANQRRGERAQKRSAGAIHLTLDFETIDALITQSANGVGRTDPEAEFEKEWVRTLYERALLATRLAFDGEDKKGDFAMFARYALAEDGISYQDLAGEHGLPVTTITNRLAGVRRRFRTEILRALRAECTSEAEYREEAQRLLGVQLK